MRNLISILSLFCCVGCGATLDTSRTYEAPRAQVAEAPQLALLDAVRRNALVQGWQVVRVDRDAGLLEALVAVDAPAGGEARERWSFQVGAGWVRAGVSREFRDGGDARAWRSSGDLCESYGYYAERMQLARVTALASGADPAMAALAML